VVDDVVIQLVPVCLLDDTFAIVAHHASRQNGYILFAKLNGQPLNRAWITQAEIINGGTLEFEMGILPNKSWGTE